MTWLTPGCVNCPTSLQKHFPKPRNGGPEHLPKLCCYCDFDGCNAEGVKMSKSAASSSFKRNMLIPAIIILLAFVLTHHGLVH